jgi:hypothetical protein
MAAQTTEYHERVVFSASGVQGIRVSWGGIWSGFLFALGVFLLLTVLGMAIGVSAVDIGTADNTSARSLGIGAGVWGAATLLVALFVGGWVATRAGMVHDGATGMIEGVLIWVLSVLTLIYMASSGVALLANGVFGSIGSVAQTATAAVRGGVDVEAIANGDVGQITARLNDPKTVSAVAAAAGMQEAEARTTLSDIAAKVDAAKADPARAVAEARQGLKDIASRVAARGERAAARAQPAATTTMWTALASLVVALIAAIAGAMIGRRQVAARLVEAAAATHPVQP